MISMFVLTATSFMFSSLVAINSFVLDLRVPGEISSGGSGFGARGSGNGAFSTIFSAVSEISLSTLCIATVRQITDVPVNLHSLFLQCSSSHLTSECLASLCRKIPWHSIRTFPPDRCCPLPDGRLPRVGWAGCTLRSLPCRTGKWNPRKKWLIKFCCKIQFLSRILTCRMTFPPASPVVPSISSTEFCHSPFTFPSNRIVFGEEI